MRPLDTVLCPVRDRPVSYELLCTACLYFAECHGDEADTISASKSKKTDGPGVIRTHDLRRVKAQSACFSIIFCCLFFYLKNNAEAYFVEAATQQMSLCLAVPHSYRLKLL